MLGIFTMVTQATYVPLDYIGHYIRQTYYRTLIGNCRLAIKWYKFRRPWV